MVWYINCFPPSHFSCIFQGKDHFAIGAPKANSLRGRVYLCHDCFGEARGRSYTHLSMDSITLNGFKFGERFGHSVCAVDLNGDRVDDLVVGAPLYSEENQV